MAREGTAPTRRPFGSISGHRGSRSSFCSASAGRGVGGHRNEQEPYVYGSLGGEPYYFVPQEPAGPPEASTKRPPGQQGRQSHPRSRRRSRWTIPPVPKRGSRKLSQPIAEPPMHGLLARSQLGEPLSMPTWQIWPGVVARETREVPLPGGSLGDSSGSADAMWSRDRLPRPPQRRPRSCRCCPSIRPS